MSTSTRWSAMGIGLFIALVVFGLAMQQERETAAAVLSSSVDSPFLAANQAGDTEEFLTAAGGADPLGPGQSYAVIRAALIVQWLILYHK